MRELEAWTLDELISRVTDERLIDDCIRGEDHVIIVQGTTRFVLDPGRARAFLRGVIKGMSPSYRRHAKAADPDTQMDSTFLEAADETGLFDTFRRYLVKKWWGKYADAGKPCGRSVRGLMLWIRYNTETTVN